jgi:RHS repeat-associated protein
MTKLRKESLKVSLRPVYLRKRGIKITKFAPKTPKIPGAITVYGESVCPKKFTGKELDPETGLNYYGARYLDPKTSRWLSGDPAMGEYFPSAPVNDEAKKRNGNLPGQGGVFNYVNLHAYHYAGNNPVVMKDSDGRILKRFTSTYHMGDSRWGDTPVGYSSNISANYMRNIGCAVTGLANGINTLNGTNYLPAEINDKKYFSDSGTDDNKSDINFSKVASNNNLKHTLYFNGFKDKIQEIKNNTENTVVLALVLYSKDSDTAKHYVGVNDLVTIEKNDYIEISPTSSRDLESSSRRNTWLYQDGKVYVPVSEIKRLDVLAQKQE